MRLTFASPEVDALCAILTLILRIYQPSLCRYSIPPQLVPMLSKAAAATENQEFV